MIAMMRKVPAKANLQVEVGTSLVVLSMRNFSVTNPSFGLGSATKDRTTTADGPRIWPWELPGYDFSTIPYKHGTKKDMEDWRPDDDSVA